MREHLEEEEEGERELLSTSGLISSRLEDLDGTLRGANRRDEPIRLEFDFIGELINNLIRAVVISVLPATVALFGTAGVLISAAVPKIRHARVDTLTAEADYHEALRNTQPVLAELTALGAPTGEIETVYFAFADAHGDELRKAADIYLGVLSDQIAEIDRTSDGTRTATVVGLLAPTVNFRRDASAAYGRWQEGVSSARGRLAVTFGMEIPPPEAMALYERPHPRSR